MLHRMLQGDKTTIETKLTNEEMYHISSCLFVMCVIGLLTVRLVAYIRLDLLSPIMQFIFLLLAIWSFFESFHRHQKLKIGK